MISTTPRTLCAALPHATPGDTVRLQGWVHRRRELAALTFLVVRDRTGLAQVVVKDARAEVPPEETTVEVVGTLTANDAAPGGVEVTDPQVRALTEPAATPPVELWRPALNASLPTLLDHAPVAWRHPAQRARWELAAATLRGFRSTLDGLGFTEIQTPKFVASATESGANVFEVDYFGRPAYLAQSPQFYKQQLVGVFERVYEVGPVFRAEPHDTVRHLAEYVSLDVELGFIEDHRDVLAMLRRRGRGHGRRRARARRRRRRAAVRVRARWSPTRSRCCTSRRRSPSSVLPPTSRTWPPSTSGRSARGRWPSTAATSSPSRATRCASGRSTRIRSRRTRSGPTASTCCSAGWSWSPAASGCTGPRTTTRRSARAARTRPTTRRTSRRFRHGMPPHGGFAIGLERWVARLVEAANIREVTLFPRDLTRLTP